MKENDSCNTATASQYSQALKMGNLVSWTLRE